jgi:hypothetical protein
MLSPTEMKGDYNEFFYRVLPPWDKENTIIEPILKSFLHNAYHKPSERQVEDYHVKQKYS